MSARPLFPLPEPVHQEKLSADQRRTLKQRQLIDAGINPGTYLSIIDNGETCGSCGNLVTVQPGRRRFFKCALMPDTRGPGSDIRKWWPACTAWIPTPDHTRGVTVDDLIDNIDELLASRTPESTEGDT